MGSDRTCCRMLNVLEMNHHVSWRGLEGPDHLGCCQRQRSHGLFYSRGSTGSRLDFPCVPRLKLTSVAYGNPWFPAYAAGAFGFLSELLGDNAITAICEHSLARVRHIMRLNGVS